MAEDKKDSLSQNQSKSKPEKKALKKARAEETVTQKTTEVKSSSESQSKEQEKALKKIDTQKEKQNSTQKASSSKETSGQKAETLVKEQKAETTIKEEPDKEEPKAEEKIKTEELKDSSIQLEGLFAFKLSMTTFYNDQGESVPVTALKYEPCRVSQIKNPEKESYSAVQVAFKAQKNKRCSKALIGHLSSSGFKEGARFVKEIRQKIPEGIQLGQEVSIQSLKKGDWVKISSLSKGRGFTGVMKKWNFAGGKASHGSKSHRRIGSIGQHTEPSRVMPGRKMPGQHGFKKVSYSKVPVVDVLPEEGMIFVKGAVPGARNTLVSLKKMPRLS